MKVNKYELAEKLGVSHQAVYKWFNGQSKPSVDNLVRISKVLGITVQRTLELLKISSKTL